MLTTITIAVIVLALCFTIAVAGFVFSLHSSDAAGNGLAVGFTAIALIILWLLLALLQVLAAFGEGEATPILRIATVATFLFAAVTQAFILDTLSHKYTPRLYVALLRLAVIAVPLLFLTLATWRAFPTIRAYAPSATVPWTLLALATALGIPPCVHKLTTARRRKRAAAA